MSYSLTMSLILNVILECQLLKQSSCLMDMQLILLNTMQAEGMISERYCLRDKMIPRGK